MRFRTSAVLFKRLVALETLYPKLVFTAEPKKLTISAISTDKVSMMILTIPNPLSEFSIYDFSGDSSEKYVINTSELKMALKHVKKTSDVEVIMEKEKLSIIRNKTEFKFELLDSEEELIKIPSLDFQAKVEIPSDLFRDVLGDVNAIADSLAITAYPDRVTFQSSEHSGKNIRFELGLSKEDAELYSCELKEGVDKVSARYPMDVLMKISRISDVADITRLEFSSDYPIKITFPQADRYELSFIVAPRLEE